MKYYCVLLIALLLTAHPGYGQSTATEDRYPNIILIMTDDQGWGDVAYNGHPYLQTPHLDQMVREGVELLHHCFVRPGRVTSYLFSANTFL